MPRSDEYREMYVLLASKYNLNPVETLQTAVLIDILAAMEQREPKTNVAPRKPRRPKSSQ